MPHNGIVGPGQPQFYYRNSIVAQGAERRGMERREILVQ